LSEFQATLLDGKFEEQSGTRLLAGPIWIVVIHIVWV